jgi:hypothetical protein
MRVEPGIHYGDRHTFAGEARISMQTQASRQNTEHGFGIERPGQLNRFVKCCVTLGKQDPQEILLHAGRATAVVLSREGIPVRLRASLWSVLHATARTLRNVFHPTLPAGWNGSRAAHRYPPRPSSDSLVATKFRPPNIAKQNGDTPRESTTLAYSQRVRIPGERPSSLPRGVTAFGAFLIFGTTMALLAAATLLFSGTPLDRIWKLNSRAHEELIPFGKIAGFGFALLSVALALAAVGWFRRRSWGWRLAVALIAAQVLGNLVNLFRGRILEGAVGITIAAALLVYLLSRPIRVLFVRRPTNRLDSRNSSF